MTRKLSPDLTVEETANVLRALRFLRTRCGGWPKASDVLGFSRNSIKQIMKGQKSVSATLTLRVARVVKVPIDDVLTGKFPPPNACPHCGLVGEAVELTAL